MEQYNFAQTGRTARVNLTTHEIKVEDYGHYIKDYFGGSGLAAKILYDELKDGTGPLDPENKIIFSAGALIGTLAPGACKMAVSTLSPMTGGWGTGSSDSYVAMELKNAGYDNIIVEGKAEKPCYIFVNNGIIEIRDAKKLWGKTTWETLEAIREELKDDSLHIVSIGPAGENLVRGACIIQDKSRAFGRCGQGAVMGSKNLKAVVARGSIPIRIYDKERFLKRVLECRDRINNNPNTENFRKYGTMGIFEHKQHICAIPYKNFQYTALPDEIVDKVNPKQLVDKYETARQSFPGCAIGCSRHLHITDGPYKGLKTEANQWEIMGAVEAKLGVTEATFMPMSNALCNQLGIDVDLVGGAIGWAMECYERGIITEADTGGIALKWGDQKTILKLIEMIARREGFGNILAEGCARAADTVGEHSKYYALNIKKQDLYESLRASNAWCLGVVTSTRGGGHTTGTPVSEQMFAIDNEKAMKIFGVDNAGNPLDYHGKAELVYYFEVLHRACNSFGICHQNTVWNNLDYMNIEDITEIISAATGIEFTLEKMRENAMRILNTEKALNNRFTDFDRKDDMPTDRELNEPIKTGALKGWKFDIDKFNTMLDRYYEMHGWDKETSFPTRSTLEALGLKHIADDMEKIGKLGK